MEKAEAKKAWLKQGLRNHGEIGLMNKLDYIFLVFPNNVKQYPNFLLDVRAKDSQESFYMLKRGLWKYLEN